MSFVMDYIICVIVLNTQSHIAEVNDNCGLHFILLEYLNSKKLCDILAIFTSILSKMFDNYIVKLTNFSFYILKLIPVVLFSAALLQSHDSEIISELNYPLLN